MPALKSLNLNDNQIADIEEVENLCEKDIYKLTYLERLDLKNTPIAKDYGVEFKQEILMICYEFTPFLTHING